MNNCPLPAVKSGSRSDFLRHRARQRLASGPPEKAPPSTTVLPRSIVSDGQGPRLRPFQAAVTGLSTERGLELISLYQRQGEISLARQGLLCLDKLAEFSGNI